MPSNEVRNRHENRLASGAAVINGGDQPAARTKIHIEIQRTNPKPRESSRWSRLSVLLGLLGLAIAIAIRFGVL